MKQAKDEIERRALLFNVAILFGLGSMVLMLFVNHVVFFFMYVIIQLILWLKPDLFKWLHILNLGIDSDELVNSTSDEARKARKETKLSYPYTTAKLYITRLLLESSIIFFGFVTIFTSDLFTKAAIACNLF